MKSTDRIVKVDVLINETYLKLEELSYSMGSLKKFKYSFQVFKEYALKNERQIRLIKEYPSPEV